ncbi:hypothetical protein LTR36_008618 [Oleoguttula mirabilis]|uniref:Uncharacterized protein n=1 Tax=Oleoguttula mirabilis TaxID=1507867 RepID=A0AAV9JTK4_9PEZI|nr:hypothetical protein LTR36_008618 [Oleoguttula mirabilis]
MAHGMVVSTGIKAWIIPGIWDNGSKLPYVHHPRRTRFQEAVVPEFEFAASTVPYRVRRISRPSQESVIISFAGQVCDYVLHICGGILSREPIHAVKTPPEEAPRLPTPAPSASHGPEPTLLGMPPELRNQIYECTLPSDDGGYIKRDNFSQPGLLRTNHQIRSETITMWYARNRFRIDVTDLDPSVLMAFHRHAKNYHGPMRGVGFVVGLSPDWTNLLRWLKWHHSVPAWGWTGGYDERAYCKVVARAFDIVEELQRAPWHAVARVLKLYKMAVEEQNHGAWSWA